MIHFPTAQACRQAALAYYEQTKSFLGKFDSLQGKAGRLKNPVSVWDVTMYILVHIYIYICVYIYTQFTVYICFLIHIIYSILIVSGLLT